MTMHWPADRVERRPVADLVPYARNSRTHSPAQVSAIAASIREWGWTTPVLIDPDGGIIAGHGRVLAAQQLGIAEVPCMVAEGWTEAQRRAYIIADNRLPELAGWDEEMLRLELDDLRLDGYDLDLTGWDESALADIAGGAGVDSIGENRDIDDTLLPIGPRVSALGDIWRLGDHRLLCGDSRTGREVACAGVTPDIVLLDPPYDNADAWTWHGGADRLIVFTDHKHIAEAMSQALQFPVIYNFVWDTVVSWYTTNRPLCRHRSAFYCAH